MTTPDIPVEQPSPERRTWTSADGKFTTEAEFIGMAASVITLRKTDATTVKVPIDQLSEDDRQWIEARRMERRQRTSAAVDNFAQGESLPPPMVYAVEKPPQNVVPK